MSTWLGKLLGITNCIWKYYIRKNGGSTTNKVDPIAERGSITGSRKRTCKVKVVDAC